AATIKSKQNLRHPFHRIEQAMPARSLRARRRGRYGVAASWVASRHGLEAVLSDPDDPKLLDFRPVEAHSSKHQRLQIDQASVAERRAALPRARSTCTLYAFPACRRSMART